jgi:hypothetical protein
MLWFCLSEVLEPCMSAHWHPELVFLRIGPAPALDLVSHAVAADVASVCHQQVQRSTQKVSKQGSPVSSHLSIPLPLMRDRMCVAMSESRNTVAQRFCWPMRCGRRMDGEQGIVVCERPERLLIFRQREAFWCIYLRLWKTDLK